MERLEHAKASIRHRKTHYKGLAKNTAQSFSLFALANLFMARRWLLDAYTQDTS